MTLLDRLREANIKAGLEWSEDEMIEAAKLLPNIEDEDRRFDNIWLARFNYLAYHHPSGQNRMLLDRKHRTPKVE
jgi:hypothetical protein